MAQLVKNLPAVRETWVQSLGWEDPLEKGAATHSSILAWRTLWVEGGAGKESNMTEQLSLVFIKFKLISFKTVVSDFIQKVRFAGLWFGSENHRPSCK